MKLHRDSMRIALTTRRSNAHALRCRPVLSLMTTRHQPQRARSFELGLCAVGSSQGRPEGGRLFISVWGVRGRALSHARPPVFRACGRGPLPTGCWCGVRAWGPVTNPTARALASWLCALRGGHEAAPGGGGRLLPGCGMSVVGCSPTPVRPPLGRAAGAPYPLAVGAVCQRGDPLPIPLRALLRADLARCGGRTRAPGGGSSLVWLWGVPGCALCHARRPVLGACGRGPLPTGCGCGGDFARCGGRNKGAPGGGAFLACVWGLRGQALSHARPPLLRACDRGPLPTGCGCGVQAWGTITNPTARALASWLCALRGRHEGAPGGGVSYLGVGRPWLCALPRPTACPSGVRLGPATHWLRMRGVWAWGPVTSPTARALLSWLCALWGRHEGALAGASLACVWASVVGRSPTADRLSFGRAVGAHYPLAVAAVCWRGDLSATPLCALLQAGFARCAGGTRAPRGGGASLAWVWGVCGCALSHARPSVLRTCGQGLLPTGCGCGVRAWGPVTNPSAPACWLCELRGRHEGAPGGEGGDSCLGVGRPSFGALPRPTASLSGVRPGPATHWLCMRGVWAWGPVINPTARALASWLSAAGAARGCPRGGGAFLAWVWGVRCWALSHARPPVLRACGRGRLPTGCGCGVRAWGPVTNPIGRASASWLCALWGLHEGAPGGGASLAWVWDVPGCALPHARPPVLRARGRGLLPTGCGCGVRAWGPVTKLTARALASWLCALQGRHVGAPGGGGRLLPGCGASVVGRFPTPNRQSFGRAAGARYPLAMGPVCGRGVLAVGGTFSCAVVRRVMCAFPGFAAPGGRYRLAPFFLLWLWPAACLTGLFRGPALVRRASSGPIAPGAPVGFLVAGMPSPTPEAFAPGFTGWLRGAHGGRPGTRLFVPAAGRCRGRGDELAARRTRSEPRGGVVPGGSLRLRSWAACAAVVGRVWTRSLTRPVSRAVCLATGDSASALGLFSVYADTSSFRVGGRHARVPRVCAFACPSWPGRAGRPLGRLFGAPHLSFGRFVSLLCLAPFRLGLPFLVLLFASPVVSSPFSVRLSRSGCLWLFMLPGPGCRGTWRSSFAPPPPFPPPFFFPLFVSCFASGAPLSQVFRCFWPWVPLASALPAPPPSSAPPSRAVCLLWRFFVFFCRSCFLVVPSALGFCSPFLGFFFLFRVPPCVWCVRCVLGLCPPSPPVPACVLLVWCRIVSCCGLLWTGLCGSRLFFGALWCYVVLCGVLLCCVVGVVAGGLPWALSPPVLCRAP